MGDRAAPVYWRTRTGLREDVKRGKSLMSHTVRSRLVLLLTEVMGARRSDLSSGLPYPTDSPHVTIDGPDPDRLLLMGSGVMTGSGVSSHSMSIAGNLARDITAATGRGIEVDIVPISGLLARHAALRLKAIPLDGYDAVVVAVGINDALIGTPRREWRHGIQAMLSVIKSTLPARGQIFLVTIADPTTTPLFRALPARLAARHALALNADSRTIAAAHPQLTLIDFEVGAIDDPSRLYTKASYARWSHQLAPSIIAGLNRVHSSR